MNLTQKFADAIREGARVKAEREAEMAAARERQAAGSDPWAGREVCSLEEALENYENADAETLEAFYGD